MRLQVFVAPNCCSCDEARVIAEDVRARFPMLGVDVINFDECRLVPHNVVATPTYVLDGTVISLGNPDRQMLVRTILRHGAS